MQAEKEIINRMCVEAAKGFELQYGRKYGIGTSELPSRQTAELHKLQLLAKFFIKQISQLYHQWQ